MLVIYNGVIYCKSFDDIISNLITILVISPYLGEGVSESKFYGQYLVNEYICGYYITSLYMFE